MRRILIPAVLLVASVFSAAFIANVANAETHIIQMLNKAPGGTRMAFYPNFLKAAPGDIIRFEATDKGHSVQSMDGMLPDGVEGWKGKLNKSLEITVTEPGVYGYKCQPHFGLGMVGMFVVTGAPANLETAKAVKVRGRKPKKAFKKLFEQATVQ